MISNAEDAAARLQKIALVNSLDLPGKTPFHLKMSFQLYDLAGKPSDTGILEEWWASPGRSRTTIIASSLKQTVPVVFNDSLAIDPRERYLVEELLRAETHPLPAAPPKPASQLDEAKRQVEKTKLLCFNTPPLDYSLGAERPGPWLPYTFCTDPGTDTLLLEFTERTGHTIAHKDLGVFHDTSIPLELQISYNDKLAIVGKVVQINSIDPLASEVELSLPPQSGAADSTQHRLIWAAPDKCASPPWPDAAWFAHENGYVLLSGRVTKSGSVRDIAVIASAKPVFMAATVGAFSKCTFKPSRLDGEPMEDRVVFQGDFTAINHSGIAAFTSH